MNIAQGKDAIASQINTITVQQDGKTRTVVSQQISGNGNTCSGTGSVVINGVRMQGGESVTVIDGDVFINKKTEKMEQDKERAKGETVADAIKAEVFRLHGKAGQRFSDALDSLIEKPTSKARQDVVIEEFTALNLHQSPVITTLLSNLAFAVDSAKEQAKKDVERLRNETAKVAPEIKNAHAALVDIIAAEVEKESPTVEIIERAKYAIKLLTDQE